MALLIAAVVARGASMAIDSLSGPVTQNEINSFMAYMKSQSPPPTPWGALNGTGHNAWADGTGGRELEAMGEMFEVSSNMTILNQMINWSDYCTSQRNDLMAATNGGQRVMWTGLIDKVWVPNWPTDMTDNQAQYCGCESEDTIGHLAYCAKLILKTPAIWNLTVPDGNPYGYGTTYRQRATNYLAKCDEANDEYFLKWFIQPGTSLIVPPTNATWVAVNENVTANNRQMMFTSGFQRLAEAHELLGDNPARVAQYDAIVQATVNQDLNGMTQFHPYTTNGVAVYDWGYYPTKNAPEATEIHAEYDIIGVWRAFNRLKYGYTLAPLVPFANTMVQVIYRGTNTFNGDVAGGSGTQSPIYSGWILSADWNPQVYSVVAGAAYAKGWYSGSADIDAGILFQKNRRYLQFSVTPALTSTVLSRNAQTNITVAIAPLGGFTNIVSLSVAGLPVGSTGTFNVSSINCAALSYCQTNVTLNVSNSSSTPLGTYPLSIIGTSGSVTHTSIVNLVVGSFAVSASPSSQTVSAGAAANYTVTVTTNNGFGGMVSFGIVGLPIGASATFSPITLSGAGNSIVTVNTTSSTPVGTYTLTVNGTNGTVVPGTTVSLVVVGAMPVWNGLSTLDSYWSDKTNWSGNPVSPQLPLIFGGSARLNNTNDTAAATVYSNILFDASAGTFTLNGNAITLAGNITNSSANPETINLGLNFGGNLTLDGDGDDLIIAGGLTNTVTGATVTTLLLEGTGQLVNKLKSATTNPGGTNIILMSDSAAEWALSGNASSTVPWLFEINDGTFDFGAADSAPSLNSTSTQGVPNDNQVGAVSGDTATFNMVSGTFTSTTRFNTAMAADATGIINQSGGTMNIGSQFQGANGSHTGEVSIVNVTGGAMNIGGGNGPFFVASRGNGTLAVDGTGIVNCGKLDISRNAAGSTFESDGTVNLDGGVLMVTSVTNLSANQQTGGAPTAAFNFNGGTLVAKSGAATIFFQGSLAPPVTPIITTVQAGGAVIDDGGNAIIIPEPLQHDPDLGTDLDGGLTKLDSGTLTLAGTNTYNGETSVNAGTLALTGSGSINNSTLITVMSGATFDVTAVSGSTLSLASGQMLTGNGTIKGNVIVSNGALLAPGGSLSTLVLNNNLTLASGSTTVIETSKSPKTNDTARVTGALTYGGALVVTNVSGNPYAAGDTFRIFNAAAYAGTFTSISPVIPALNLAWNTNQMNTGILAIVSSPTAKPVITAFQMLGGNFIIAGTNGVANWPCALLETTNLTLPLNQWTLVDSNYFDSSGNLNFTNTLPAQPPTFYRLALQPQ